MAEDQDKSASQDEDAQVEAIVGEIQDALDGAEAEQASAPAEEKSLEVQLDEAKQAAADAKEQALRAVADAQNIRRRRERRRKRP